MSREKGKVIQNSGDVNDESQAYGTAQTQTVKPAQKNQSTLQIDLERPQ